MKAIGSSIWLYLCLLNIASKSLRVTLWVSVLVYTTEIKTQMQTLRFWRNIECFKGLKKDRYQFIYIPMLCWINARHIIWWQPFYVFRCHKGSIFHNLLCIFFFSLVHIVFYCAYASRIPYGLRFCWLLCFFNFF